MRASVWQCSQTRIVQGILVAGNVNNDRQWRFLFLAQVEAEANTDRQPLPGFTPRQGAGIPLFGKSSTYPPSGPVSTDRAYACTCQLKNCAIRNSPVGAGIYISKKCGYAVIVHCPRSISVHLINMHTPDEHKRVAECWRAMQDIRVDFQFSKGTFAFNFLPFTIPYPVPFKALGDETKVQPFLYASDMSNILPFPILVHSLAPF